MNDKKKQKKNSHVSLSTKMEYDSILQGAEEILVESEFITKLENSRANNNPLKIKLGLDPTSTDLHLGHAVVLRKLRLLQNHGHIVVLLIGDFTSLIGDPTGRNTTRPKLTKEEIKENAKTYFSQASLILDESKTIIRYNSEWCQKLGANGLISLASQVNVARMLEREDFNKRYKSGTSIAIHEFIYPIIQGYDSVILRSDLEIGGTDQKFNLLMGRALQKNVGIEPQSILTMPLLEGTDGFEKMSKSKDNFIGLTEDPNEIFGKIMSISDELMWRYMDLLSNKTSKQITKLKKDIDNGKNPKDVKVDLGMELVECFHNKSLAKKAHSDFVSRFKHGGIPENIEQKFFSGPNLNIVSILKNSGMVSSNSEAMRNIEQGGVRIDGEKILDRNIILGKGIFILQVGKRKFMRININN
tara:strand:+ start:858 stop:2102 length:1245 start_codon:yes stop_codon:yes gene_type:complete